MSKFIGLNQIQNPHDKKEKWETKVIYLNIDNIISFKVEKGHSYSVVLMNQYASEIIVSDSIESILSKISE